MKFKTDNLFLYVEGIQFRNGEYSTTKKNEIEILKKYSDTVKVIKEENKTK
ncbi:hypothetical protein [Haloimpatiens massiliensis]|uniref:hypothetical protein n=1 Tax=Haloimpatiens massiliensis TaxID=1658110 RepID=UPI0015E10AD8|nr:hypothetical protein [Haloimpatiens massiliensis]